MEAGDTTAGPKPQARRSGYRSPQQYVLTVAAFIFFPLSFLAPLQTIDIHLHDTYYIIAYKMILLFASAFLLLLSVAYGLAHRLLVSPLLGWLHSVGTVICVSVITLLPWALGRIPRFIDLSGRMLSFPGQDGGGASYLFAVWFRVLFVILIVLQAMFAVHLLLGAARRLRSRR